MRILITGSEGYIGSVLVPLARAEGHDVVGLDAGWFAHCTFGPPAGETSYVRADIRDIRRTDLCGFDAVLHLAALSNDPLGSIDGDVTFDINHRATVRLARLAKEAGVPRYAVNRISALFCLSCFAAVTCGSSALTIVGTPVRLR